MGVVVFGLFGGAGGVFAGAGFGGEEAVHDLPGGVAESLAFFDGLLFETLELGLGLGFGFDLGLAGGGGPFRVVL